MHASASEQIEAIHAMMASGHRSVRLERHTLIVWGVAGALVILLAKAIFTPERFPVVWQRAVAANLFIAAALLAAGVWDYVWTRRARRARDETLSFVQQQVMKVWWLLMGLIVLLNLGMNFFGGGYMIYGVVLALMGLAFYVHGLFSTQMLAWIGALLIALGLGSVALNLPFPVMEWLTIVVLGAGLPLLGLVLRAEPWHATVPRRLLLSCVWLALMIGLTTASAAIAMRTTDPQLPLVSLKEFAQFEMLAPARAVRLPAGTVIPVRMEVTGDVLAGENSAILPLRLARDVDVVVRGGKPDGYFRVQGGEWKKYLYHYRVRALDMHSTLTPSGGPQASVRIEISVDN